MYCPTSELEKMYTDKKYYISIRMM